MGLSKRTGTRLATAGLVLLAAALAFDGWQLQRLNTLNARIAAGAVSADEPGAEPEQRFAAAHALAAAGATEAATHRYAALAGDTPLGQAARFNGANLLLRQALALRAASQNGQALALVELAKEGYREVLRQDSGHWPARYNLERAQRLVPDPEDAEDEPPAAARGAERAATTMRGYSPGLP